VAWCDGVTVCTCSCTAEKRRLSLPGRGRRAAPGEGRSCRRATSSRVPSHHGPAGRPAGSPLHCPAVGCRIVCPTRISRVV